MKRTMAERFSLLLVALLGLHDFAGGEAFGPATNQTNVCPSQRLCLKSSTDSGVTFKATCCAEDEVCRKQSCVKSCDNFTWPPKGTVYCNRDSDCEWDESCEGCMASECDCREDGTTWCTEDCDYTCKKKFSNNTCEGFLWPPKGVKICDSDEDCSGNQECRGCLPSRCGCKDGNPHSCSSLCLQYCHEPRTDKCEDWTWPPKDVTLCNTVEDCSGDEECRGCMSSSCSCKDGKQDLCTMDCRTYCAPPSDGCEDFVYPPVGVVFCDTDSDCAEGVCDASACQSSSCDCKDGKIGLCTADCRSVCRTEDSASKIYAPTLLITLLLLLCNL
eukprot:m.13850 g.13850  ORF g.13850 m.13850 type:complete len:330 (-) comp4939_c0_seq1:65-1054(-)